MQNYKAGEILLRFECDYTEGMHPRILEQIIKTNGIQMPGYGEDEYCERARTIIRLACGCENMDVHFLVGGTQANATVVSAALRTHQAVVCAESGHVAVHESGAIEATGHKVISIPSEDGKITAAQVKKLVEEHWDDVTHEHCPQPAMVYVSQPTETGLLYTLSELRELRRICSQKSLLLYCDGARLGYGLGSEINDVLLADYPRLFDVFYIGGTKVGAMFGEAVCIVNDALRRDFRYIMKQHGGMLAKGRFLGLQFETLFIDGLYLELGKKADEQAMRIRDAFLGANCGLMYNSYTNQQYPIVNNEVFDELSRSYSFAVWKKLAPNRTAIRIATSWATRDEDVDVLVEDIRRICRDYSTPTPSWSADMPE
jgi:threonine aldolase